VFYKTSGNLARIVPDYYDFIFATIKQPLQPFTGSPPSGSGITFIVSDNAKVISSEFLLISVPFDIMLPLYHVLGCDVKTCF